MRIQVYGGPGEIVFQAWDELLGLLQDAFAGMDGRIDPPSSLKGMTEADLRHKAQRERLIVALDDDRLIGCAYADVRTQAVYVGKVAVRADVRGRGVARRLMAEAEAIAADAGRPLLELQTRVELTENHATFAALGFRQVAQTAHAGYDRPTSITMQRPVSRPAPAPEDGAGAGSRARDAAAIPPEIRDFFDAYGAAFDALDGARVAALYAEPSAIAQAGVLTVWPQRSDVAANMDALCALYRQRGYRGAVFEPRCFIGQGRDYAVVDLAWRIDWAAEAPWAFSTTYNLVRTGEGWRVLLCTAYDEDRLHRREAAPDHHPTAA